MRKAFKILLPFILAGCTQTVFIRNLPQENGGHLYFGKEGGRNLFVPVSITDSLKLKWETATYGSYNNSSVIGYDKYIITHDLSGYIHCFDKNDGKEIGALNYSGAIFSTPALYKSRMLYIVNNGEEKTSTIYYYDLKDGKVLSKTDLTGSFTNQVLKNENAFFIIGDRGGIFKFNFAGVLEWEYQTGMQVLSIPAMKEGIIYFASTKGELASFDYNRKELLRKKEIGEAVYSGIVIDGNYGYTAGVRGGLYCFDLKTLEIKWKGETGSKAESLPVCGPENVIISNLSGKVTCFNKTTGRKIWEKNFGGAPLSTPLLFKNLLVMPNLDRYLYLIDPADGTLKKRIKTGGRMKLSPVYMDGLIIVGYDKGNIGAYEVTEEK